MISQVCCSGDGNTRWEVGFRPRRVIGGQGNEARVGDRLRVAALSDRRIRESKRASYPLPKIVVCQRMVRIDAKKGKGFDATEAQRALRVTYVWSPEERRTPSPF